MVQPVGKSYVEFGGPNDYVNCHSCQGTGIVPKEAQEGLIALIPHDDDRLKPKRRAFYIGIGILAGATACGNGTKKFSKVSIEITLDFRKFLKR